MKDMKKFFNQDITSWLNKHKLGLTSALVLVLIGIVGMFITYAYFQVSDTQTVIGATVQEIPDLDIRIYAEERDTNGNGLNSYSEYPYIPQAGYVYNSTKSYCTNGSTITYDDTTYTADIAASGHDVCYLYFDSIAQLDITITVMAEDIASDGTGTGTYTKLETTALPSVGYKFNHYECDGTSTISYSDAENLFTVESSGKDNCTVWMDAVNPDIGLIMYVQNGNDYEQVNKIPSGCYELRSGEADYNSSCTGTSTLAYENGKVVIRATSQTSCVAYLDKKTNDLCSAGEFGRSLYTSQGTNGIYYHNEKLRNGAGDNSYRYAGANPSNYVCLSSSTTCAAGDLYRIIGVIPVDVVVDETDPTNIITTKQNLIKLIKNDYLTSTEASTGTGTYNSSWHPATYEGPSGNQYTSDPQGYYWTGSSNNQSNTWSTSILNTTTLNTEYITTLGTTASSIAKVMWKVGGSDWENTRTATPMSIVYTNEITNSGQDVTNAPTDGKTALANKIGLMYVSDYGYAAPQSAWTVPLYNDNGIDYRQTEIARNNWIYRGVVEWTGSRIGNETYTVHNITYAAYVDRASMVNAFAVRPVFYLNSSTLIDMSHTGTSADPYRLG